MTINLTLPDLAEMKPRITVFGVGGAGGNAVNNMIASSLAGVEFVVANTDAQALQQSASERRIHMGASLTEGLGAGSQPQIGAAAAEEALPEIIDHISGAHMVFITAGMGGGTGTGAAPVIARAAKEQGVLTVGVVTKPFQFEGQRRMMTAERGIEQLSANVDTLIVIPNQNLFRIANEKTTFADAFAMADEVLYSGVASITELMTKEGLINLDFADVRAVMSEMGKAMMGTGEASGEKRAIEAAEAAISNPLLDDVSMRGSRGLLISITGGNDLTLYEVDEAATRIREEVDPDANIILGATFDHSMEGTIRVSVVATGIEDADMQNTPVVYDDYEYEAPVTSDVAAPVPVTEEVPAPLPEIPEEVAELAPAPEAAEPVHIEPAAAEPENIPAPAAAAIQMQEVAQAPAAPAMNMAPAATRMPAPEEFPPIAQAQMAAKKSGEVPEPDVSKKRKGLFERLAGVGIGRREEEPAQATQEKKDEPRIATAPKQAPMAATSFGASAAAAAVAVAREEPSPELKEEMAQAVPVEEPEEIEDEQLEIPAFLRRQAN
ncbi:MAG: cell division protein FtsZ [Hyphomicrobiales bacterium]